MKILAIDPAGKTGIAFWDTDKGRPVTYPSDVKSTMKPELDERTLSLFMTLRGTADYIIMEHPFLGQYDPKDPKQSITGYNTHIKIYHYWEQVIFSTYGRRFKLEKKFNINYKTKCRGIYPATWKSVIFKGITISGGDKAKARYAALRKWPELPRDLTSDEYDACCLCLFQWLLCRDLGISDLSAAKQQLFEKMRQGGWILSTLEEHKGEKPS